MFVIVDGDDGRGGGVKDRYMDRQTCIQKAKIINKYVYKNNKKNNKYMFM